jgi:hypothetical protein
LANGDIDPAVRGQIGYEKLWFVPSCRCSRRTTSASGFSTGNGRSTTAFSRLNTTAGSDIPRISDASATALVSGRRRIMRQP